MARTATKPEHTPTPWRVQVVESQSAGDAVALVICSLDWEVAQIELGEEDDLCRANAAFIVTAVNSHTELLNLVKQFERVCEYAIRSSQIEGDDEGARMKTITLNLVRDAIALASPPDTAVSP